MNPFGRIFPDISTCKNIALTVKSANDYKGFRFSIGNAHAPGGKFFAYGYKSDFNAGPAGQVNTVTLPLTGFTDYWDDATGAAIKTCQDDKIYCPDSKTLKDMRTMGVWAEGVAGAVHLEILNIKATECDIRAGKKVSSIELLYQMNWVMLHMIGFFAFLGPAVIIELPVALYEIITGSGGLSSWDEGPFIKHYRLVLAVMRVLCAILLLFAAPFLTTTKTRNPNTLAALKWRAEFTVGEFGATQMYFNALSVFFQPGVGPYSWLDLGLLGLLSLEAFRIFCVHGVFWLVVMNRWDSIDWAAEMKRRVPAQGPVMQGLRTLTGDELTHMHAVQAGVPDFSEWIVKASKYLPASMVATGCKYDKFRLLVVKPDNYENFRAMEFHELSSEDLDHWNKDLSRVSSALESADTVFFPYGLYKMEMMHPKALLSLSKYKGDARC
ncbi:unnamed protein product [Symbiodinium sp. CCMP2456]|nr:unnamed protein product [Symbiodinium sp. CCMP2456]